MTTDLVVGVDWLAARLGDGQVRPIDVRWYLGEPGRGRQDYLAGHVPGAAYMDIDDDLAAPPAAGRGRHPIPSPEAFAAAAGRAGIGPETHVVAYDASGGAYAARLWWLLRYFGHQRVSLLDGGWAAWVAAGQPTESGPAQVAPARFEARPRPELAIGAEAVERMRGEPGMLLLDARSPERYEGRVEPIDPRAGHIPGARSAHYAGNLRSDGGLKSADELRAHYDGLGAGSAERIVCYCGSGVTATLDIFALELAGRPGALLYEGSWSDWSNDPQREVAEGKDEG